MVKIDDHTVRIEYSKPSDNLFWVHFGKAVLAHQKKYSSQFHPEFRDKDELEALVKEAGFSNWIELYEHKLDIRGNANPERPILLAWALKQVPPGDYILERNPYFWAVDPAG
ncbi:MAG: ABC transporter substrate-binding protein, partial [Gammaproteobacteria bacterium]|nr:ABC transporter substrate-binding protein [Gammaproteobacteria bacterium]